MKHGMLYKAPILGALNRRGYGAVPLGFAVLFLLSGVYEIPFTAVDAAWVAGAKKILFVCLLVLMGCFLKWREAIRGPFFLLCGLWALLHVGQWIYRAEYAETYLHRFVQIAFIWILVSFVVQQERDSKRFLGLRSFFHPFFFPAICLFLSLFAFHPEISKALSNGMGNGRVSFSIWLSQLVFLTFLFSSAAGQTVSKAFILVTPILVLQTFTGGRTGLLVSLAIWFYFSFREGGIRWAILGGIYLAVLIPLGAAISPLPDGYPGTSIFRAIDLSHGEFGVAWFDRLSSYRLGIMTSALSTLDMDTLLLGKGVMNFKGWAIGHQWEVHNIYIRALGETGVVGLAILAALLFLPFRIQTQQPDILAAKVYCSIFLMVGMVHPELLTTAISTCMIFWVCYAETLRLTDNPAAHNTQPTPSNAMGRLSSFLIR